MNMICKSTSHVTLSQCEAVVAEGLQALEKVRKALNIIDEEKLYSDEFNSFDAYCKARWNLLHAQELIINQNSLGYL